MLLLGARRRTLREAKRLGWSAPVILDEMRAAFSEAVIKIRSLAFETRVRRLAAEAESLGATVQVAPRSAGWFQRFSASNSVRRAAESQSSGSIRRVATTETATAYSDVTVFAPAGVVLFRRWDAQGEACELCAARDGEVVGLSESFSGDEPGAVHPNCRCTWSLISESEARGYRAA